MLSFLKKFWRGTFLGHHLASKFLFITTQIEKIEGAITLVISLNHWENKIIIFLLCRYMLILLGTKIVRTILTMRWYRWWWMLHLCWRRWSIFLLWSFNISHVEFLKTLYLNNCIVNDQYSSNWWFTCFRTQYSSIALFVPKSSHNCECISHSRLSKLKWLKIWYCIWPTTKSPIKIMRTLQNRTNIPLAKFSSCTPD